MSPFIDSKDDIRDFAKWLVETYESDPYNPHYGIDDYIHAKVDEWAEK